MAEVGNPLNNFVLLSEHEALNFSAVKSIKIVNARQVEFWENPQSAGGPMHVLKGEDAVSFLEWMDQNVTRPIAVEPVEAVTPTPPL